MKTYMIGSPAFYERPGAAYLLEVEFIDVKPTFLADKKVGNDSFKTISKRLRFFKIKRIIMKATDGSASLSDKKYDELLKDHHKNLRYLEASEKLGKINYRKTFSKMDKETLLNGDTFGMEDEDTPLKLIFLEDNDEKAIEHFKYVFKSAFNFYIGPARTDIRVDLFRNDKPPALILGRNAEKNAVIGISDKNLQHSCWNINDKLYAGVDGSELNYIYDMKSRLTERLEFYINKMPKTMESFENLYNIISKYNKHFGGFQIEKVFIYNHENNIPIPFFSFEGLFARYDTPDDFEAIFLNGSEDFILNSQYFIAEKDDFMKLMKPIEHLLKDHIIVKEVDSQPENLKTYIKKEMKK